MINHKAYVQGWIASIREKPESLVHAIKDAQAAVAYMEVKAEIITPEEFKKRNNTTIEIKTDDEIVKAAVPIARRGKAR